MKNTFKLITLFLAFLLLSNTSTYAQGKSQDKIKGKKEKVEKVKDDIDEEAEEHQEKAEEMKEKAKPRKIRPRIK